jgi:hypothetical protein
LERPGFSYPFSASGTSACISPASTPGPGTLGIWLPFRAPQGRRCRRSALSGALPECSIRQRFWDFKLQRFPPRDLPQQVIPAAVPSCRFYGFRALSLPRDPLPHLGVFHPRQARSAPAFFPPGAFSSAGATGPFGPHPLLGFPAGSLPGFPGLFPALPLQGFARRWKPHPPVSRPTRCRVCPFPDRVPLQGFWPASRPHSTGIRTVGHPFFGLIPGHLGSRKSDFQEPGRVREPGFIR